MVEKCLGRDVSVEKCLVEKSLVEKSPGTPDITGYVRDWQSQADYRVLIEAEQGDCL